MEALCVPLWPLVSLLPAFLLLSAHPHPTPLLPPGRGPDDDVMMPCEPLMAPPP